MIKKGAYVAFNDHTHPYRQGLTVGKAYKVISADYSGEPFITLYPNHVIYAFRVIHIDAPSELEKIIYDIES